MKTDVHPNYPKATITCVCGAKYETKSTKGDLTVEICANCHPFFTGTQKIVDAAGRVERFKKKFKMK